MEYDETWQKRYADMILETHRAAALLRSGWRVFVGSGCGEPQTLVQAMLGAGWRPGRTLGDRCRLFWPRGGRPGNGPRSLGERKLPKGRRFLPGFQPRFFYLGRPRGLPAKGANFPVPRVIGAKGLNQPAPIWLGFGAKEGIPPGPFLFWELPWNRPLGAALGIGPAPWIPRG